MAACACGAPLTWAQTAEGEAVPLDVVASPVGEGRYRVTSFDVRPWLVEPVTPTAQVAAYTDHRLICPRR
jgi:hypothetical protein